MFPDDVRYTKEHEWVRVEGDTCVVGITSFAAEQLGDVTYVELPESSDSFAQGDEIATVESVKAASDIYAPMSGTVLTVNSELEDKPELVNESSFGEGWFFKLDNIDVSQLDGLMDAAAYTTFVEEQDH
ncbi:MAG: glycine cleavage system protein H [Candidatus Hydrogenedentota bacterium]|nr:MAG: glycine cleavage system protein H [Candidatus Hydrogenedentota bacterium]